MLRTGENDMVTFQRSLPLIMGALRWAVADIMATAHTEFCVQCSAEGRHPWIEQLSLFRQWWGHQPQEIQAGLKSAVAGWIAQQACE